MKRAGVIENELICSKIKTREQIRKEREFWPAMARCCFCGQYIKRGLLHWTNHTVNECPANKPIVYGN